MSAPLGPRAPQSSVLYTGVKSTPPAWDVALMKRVEERIWRIDGVFAGVSGTPDGRRGRSNYRPRSRAADSARQRAVARRMVHSGRNVGAGRDAGGGSGERAARRNRSHGAGH